MRLLFMVIIAFLVLVVSCIIPEFDYYSENKSVKDVIKKYKKNYESSYPDLAENTYLLVPELVQKFGYPCERHTIISKSGYILELHRIPYGRDGPSENRPAVMVQHGLQGSSADWVIPGPGKGLPYILADYGYDVWLSNARGTRYSRRHVTLHPRRNAKKFWDFSFHEIALDDIPTTVDYVRNYVNQDKIFYIGHSEGTTVSYILLSRLTEYNSKFRAVFSLAPVAYLKWFFSPLLRTLAKFQRIILILAETLGIYELGPRSELLPKIAPFLCGNGSAFQILCINVIFSISGYNYKQLNTTLIPTVFGHSPAGSSVKQAAHHAQGVNSWAFKEFDYGTEENFRRYGQTIPPDYNLKNVTAPVYLYYSTGDWFSRPKDVERLANEISNLQGKFLVMDKKFNHVDYIYAINAPELIFNPIVSIMRRH